MRLIDVGFVGLSFTWKRGETESRIDRVLTTTTRLNQFPNVVVSHLPWYKSDHRTLVYEIRRYGIG